MDLEKAYDRIHWGFLREVLRITGFKHDLINLVMDCVTSASLAVCWNGEILRPFKPSRGLRQGDPLSPYLFIFCMEVLSQEICSSVNKNEWKVVALWRNGPYLSHIFFADDLILIGEAAFSQACLMEHILGRFCGMSGQRVNKGKSWMWDVWPANE